MVRFPKDRRKYQFLSSSMRCFSQFIKKRCLKDLPLSGGLSTKSGGLNNTLASRLCFLIYNDWENHFTGLFQGALPNPVSEHAPVLLNSGGIRKGKTPLDL